MLEVNVPNNLRHGKLSETIKQVADSVKAGELVLVQNSGDFAVSTVSVVEGAKSLLLEGGVKVFQSNHLQQNEVFLPENEKEPLVKPKLHHNQVKLAIKLSKNPIDEVQERDTQQLAEPRAPPRQKRKSKQLQPNNNKKATLSNKAEETVV